MLQRHEARSFLPAPFAFALCGVAFCVWNVQSGDSIPCLTAGCTLFRNFTVAGVSLWWSGVAGFAILGLCALSGRLGLGTFCAALGLTLDCLLLLVMLGTSSCLPCLFAGLLLALTYLCFLVASHARQVQQRTSTGPLFSILLVAWACLFVANFGGMARENAEPWAMQAPADPQELVARAYFSPSCPACRQLVRELPPDQAAKLAWHPVAETDNDLRIIAAMLERLRQGDAMPQALAAALEAPLAGQWAILRSDMLLLQFRLWRNQAHVMEHSEILPLIEFSGVPAFMFQPRRIVAPQPAPKAIPQPAGHDAVLPTELNIVGRCVPQADAPCP
jgi:hypothetical protein